MAVDRSNLRHQRLKYALHDITLQIDALSSHSLLCHPATPCPAMRSFTTDVVRNTDGSLMLCYRILARPEALRLPAVLPPTAADNLWQHTCCEAFIGVPGETAYREFNFSPSGQWAVYQFHDCRQRDTHFQALAVPQIALHCQPAMVILEAHLPSALLPAGDQHQIALSAVIEATDGSKSYWALTHCAAQPDFHLRQSFTLTLNRNTP